MKLNIAVLPGDGIGPEVTAQAVKALKEKHINSEDVSWVKGKIRFRDKSLNSNIRIKGDGLDVPKRDIWIAFALGVFQVGAGLILYTLGSKVVPSAELALLSMTEVIFGPFWVWLFLGESAGGYTLFGGIILLIAIASNALSGLRRKSIL